MSLWSSTKCVIHPSRVRLTCQLLDEPDWDIFYWAVQKREPPAKWANTRLLQRYVPTCIDYTDELSLIQHAKNEGKVVRIMPALLARGGAPL